MWKQWTIFILGAAGAAAGLAACSRNETATAAATPVIEVSQEDLQAVTSMSFPPAQRATPSMAPPLLVDPAPPSPAAAPVATSPANL